MRVLTIVPGTQPGDKPTAYERGIGNYVRERDWPNTNTNAFMTLRTGHLDGVQGKAARIGAAK